MFLAAIKPEQVTAPPATPATPPAAAAPVTPGTAVPPTGAAPASAPAPAPGASAEQLVGQVSGPTAPGAAITVSSSLLTPGQEKFVGRLAQLTGLDPKVVAAWCLAEESGCAPAGREAAGNFNWLNIGYFDSGAGAVAFASPFSNPISAAEQTAKFLEGKWAGASQGIQDILHTVGQSPDQQIMAIAHSGWASSGYAGGANLRGTYNELSDLKITQSPV
jgi:hypothetical protein